MTKVTSKLHEIWWGFLCHNLKELYKVTRSFDYAEDLNQDLRW